MDSRNQRIQYLTNKARMGVIAPFKRGDSPGCWERTNRTVRGPKVLLSLSVLGSPSWPGH